MNEEEESTDLIDLALPHSHCLTCYKLNCKAPVDDLNSCTVVECEQRCGSRFHLCKKKEHEQLCSQEKVACINSDNGCPLLIPRHKLSSHLEVCPASVIHCAAEWNRWPLYSQDSQQKVVLPKANPHFHYGQLDVALAMRDQRMLIKSLNAPKKTRKVLRNPLTRRHPAVPIAHRSNSLDSDVLLSEGTSLTLSDDDSDAPWEVAKAPPGLQKSVCNCLYSASKITTDSLSTALDIVSKHMATVDHIEDVTVLFNFKVHDDLENTQEVVKQTNTNSSSVETGEKDNSKLPEDHPPSNEVGCPDVIPNSSIDNFADLYSKPVKLQDIMSVDLHVESITKYQAKPTSMFTFLCAQEFRRDEYPWHHKNVHNDIHSGLDGWMEERCPLAYMGCTFSFLRFYPNSPETYITHSTVLESFGSNISSNTSENSHFTSTKSNTCNVTLEQKDIRSLREATPEVYTSFKTDSVVKILPCYDSDSLSREMSPVAEHPDYKLSILALPFEVLQHVARLLDSFSLCNLSLSCKHFREVCRTLLDYRGIVVPVWERKKVGNKPHWSVSHLGSHGILKSWNSLEIKRRLFKAWKVLNLLQTDVELSKCDTANVSHNATEILTNLILSDTAQGSYVRQDRIG